MCGVDKLSSLMLSFVVSGMRSRPPSAVQLYRLHSVSHGHVPGQLLSVIMIHHSTHFNRSFHLFFVFLSLSVFCPLFFFCLRLFVITTTSSDTRGSCKSCPKKLTTCSMGARQCTDCKPPEECSTSAQRNTEVVVASSISTTSTSSRLATPARRKQLQRMRTRQQLRHRTNTTSTTTANPRRL